MQNKLSYHIENITPILSVKDINVSRNFYKNILGFEEADWGSDDFTSFNKDKTGIYVCRNGQGNPGTWIWIGFDGDIFQLHDQLIANGVTVLQPPKNFSWAMEMHVQDPDGHVLRFGTEPNSDEPFLDQVK
jgi:predicted lactoylglutathione lyase